jgi:hypothetical protein
MPHTYITMAMFIYPNLHITINNISLYCDKVSMFNISNEPLQLIILSI